MPALKHRLFLTYNSSELVDGAPLYVCSNSSPLKLKKEPAGHAFNEAAKRLLGYLEKVAEDEVPTPEKKEKGASPSVDSYAFKGKKKGGKDDGDQQDHYALLGLSHLRFLATEEQIRKSYREVALKHHPDKQAALILQEETEEAKQAKKEETDRHFKAIQEAYEVLIDPAKRRVYDSIDEFDDEVPSECPPENFFKVFGPVFARNGRWSTVQPVPSLGEDQSTMADVDTFYDFWWSFKSWREFPHADEFDLDQAESREHKRWMERQNGKLREKAKKEENGRIRTLIENAYKRDPRIVRRKEEEKAEKLRKKQAKVLAKQEKELEATRALEEEKLRKELEDKKVAEEAAAQKKIREKEKKLLRKERSRLRLAAGAVTAKKDFRVSDDSVETLCTSLELVQLRCICEQLEEKRVVEEQAEMLRDIIQRVGDGTFTIEPSSTAPRATTVESAGASTPSSVNEGQPKVSAVKTTGLPNGHKSSESVEGTKKPASALNGVEKKEKPWSKQEVELLRKAVAKYPKGTSQRWEVVSNYIGTGRSVDEILRAIKTVLLQKPDSSKAFDSFLSKRKVADVSIASPLSTREESGETTGPSLTPTTNTTTPPVVANGSKDNTEGLANGVAATKEKVSGDNKAPAESQPSSNGGPASSSANGNSGGVEQDLWSEIQEIALVKALKTFPKDTAQRWERIAAAVPGKNKSQCYKKFAELRENFRSKKGAD